MKELFWKLLGWGMAGVDSAGRFVYKAFLAPASLFSFASDVVLGAQREEVKNVDGNVVEEAVKREGLFGATLNVLKAIAKAVSSFIAEHKQAIAVAAWATLAVAVGVSLALVFWPGALAVVAGASIGGLSIAAIVGANTALQIVAATTIAVVAANVAVYTGAIVVHVINVFRKVFGGGDAPGDSPDLEPEAAYPLPSDGVSSAAAMAGLGAGMVTTTPTASGAAATAFGYSGYGPFSAGDRTQFDDPRAESGHAAPTSR